MGTQKRVNNMVVCNKSAAITTDKQFSGANLNS